MANLSTSTDSSNMPSTAHLPVASTVMFDDLESMLVGSSKILRDLVLRYVSQVNDGDIPAPNLGPDSSLVILDKAVEAFSNGKPLDAIVPDIDRLSMAQEERVSIVKSLLAAHSLGRLSRLIQTQDKLERVILNAAGSGNLTVTESVVVLRLVKDGLEEVQKYLKPDSSIKDSKAVVEKADFSKKRTSEKLHKDYAGRTTATGRDIIRKVVFDMVHRLNNQRQQPEQNQSVELLDLVPPVE